MKAASTTLDLRGDISTGWAMAHRMICRARLKEGEKALDLYRKFIIHKMAENLWSMHPPFQIDGNFGVMSSVIEMLLQSHAGAIELLPALPEAWHSGSFEGLVARGNFEIAAEWEEGRLTGLSVLSRSGKKCRLKYPGLAKAMVVADKGQRVEIEVEGSDIIAFPTQKGVRYTIEPTFRSRRQDARKTLGITEHAGFPPFTRWAGLLQESPFSLTFMRKMR